MGRWIWALAALAVVCGCEAQEAKQAEPQAETAKQAPRGVRLEQIWRLEGLANPESAALSADGAFLYVTNVNGEGDARDGNGFISRVGTDGRLLEREWMRGFNAPKGIARGGDKLYVADIDGLVVVDIAAGARTRIAAPGARFLNDVAIAPDGTVLVADSDRARIYALRGFSSMPSIKLDSDGRRIHSPRGSTMEIWVEGVLLENVNGLFAEPGRLVITTMAGRLLAIDYLSREISVLSEGLANADGVAPLGGGEYLVSDWPGRMFHVHADGTHEVILDSRASNTLLNDFLLVGDVLYQPNWEPSTMTAYRVAR